MKQTLRPLVAGLILLPAWIPAPVEAAVQFAGLTVPWAQDKPSTADTIGGNPSWNAYIRPAGGAFLNGGDDSGSRFSVTFSEPGTYVFEVFIQHQSWVDDSVASPGSYVNLFFDGRTDPGISARLAGGNFGALAPLTADDLSLVQDDENGNLTAPAGTLRYRGADLFVELVDMQFAVVEDTVSAWNEFPTGSEQDSRITLTLEVTIPEPSTLLLMVFSVASFVLRRQRR